MRSKRGQDLARKEHEGSELELLRIENEHLRQANREAFAYIRSKVDSLLEVIGTKSLNPEELDDHTLIEFDPIGIVTNAFQHVLENVRSTNRQLSFAHEEIQTIFDTVGAAIMVLDQHGNVVACNQKTKDVMLGSEDDITGKSCQEYICKGQTHDERCLYKAVKSTQREQHFNDWTLNGRSFDVIGRPMFNEAGQLSHVVMSYMDVTARRDAETALLKALTETQEANARLHGIISSVGDSILVSDAKGRIVLMNRKSEELFGLCLTDRRAAHNLAILPHCSLVEFLKEAPGRERGLLVRDFVFPEPSGRERVYQARVTVIDSPATGFKGCIAILHDVTEEREVERMKSEFVSTAAHELRTPLATIIGYTDLLQMKEDCSRKEQMEYLTLIQDKAERLGEIVSDLLDISRIESGEGVEVTSEPCDLDLLCKEAINAFHHSTEKHTLSYEPAPGPAFIMADRYALMQILENVISNAIKYSPGGGNIGISVVRHDDSCQCIVSDPGIGMTSAQLEKIYDKFYRADATNTAISGTGLGMTIVKHLVDAMGGQIDISSVPGQGTKVTLAFPSADEGEHTEMSADCANQL